MLASTNQKMAHATNCDGNTPLHLACLKQQTDAVSALLATQKCALYILNKNLCTPFQCAKIQKSREIMLILIKAMFIDRDIDGNSPLHFVCQRHDYYLAKLIVDEKFNATVQNNDGDTPLHLSCRNSYLDLVKLLIEAKVDLEVQNKHGNTPLNEACMNCNYDIVKELLTANCNVRNKNNNGDMAIHHACKVGNKLIIELIVERGGIGQIKEKNHNDLTPLHFCFQNEHLVLAQSLIYKCIGKEGKAKADLVTRDIILAKVKELIKEGMEPSYLLQLVHKEQSFLHIGCIEGDIEAVQMLTGSNLCNADLLDVHNWTPLHYATIHGRVEIVQHLVSKAGSNPWLATPQGYSPLLLVCNPAMYIGMEKEQLHILKFLVTRANYHPYKAVYNGDILLTYVLKTCNFQLSIISYLISEHQCCLSSRSTNGNTALHIACMSETSNHVIKLIADQGQEYATIKNNNQETPLHIACKSGCKDIVKNYLSCFRENNGLYECDKLGNIPLLTAFNQCHYEIASILINTMYTHRDKDGNSPLHLAAMMENITLLQFIVKCSCHAMAVNSYGDTALHIACRKQNTELIREVVKINNDVQLVCNNRCETPVHITCRHGTTVLLNLLKDTDFSLNRQELESLIHVACENNHTHIVALLLEMDADINGRDKNCDTPLHIACKAESLDCCKFLLKQKCEVNLVNDNGDTALHITCRQGNTHIYEQLRKRGSNINSKNGYGDTPLLVACRFSRFKLIKEILKDPNINESLTNNAGENILHVLCRMSYHPQSLQIIQIILQSSRIDPNAPNLDGVTPIQLTLNAHIIHELLRYGAHPDAVYTRGLHIDVKHPPQPMVKIFVIGNQSVGKSTLTIALQKEIPRLINVFTPTKRVSGVEEKTAGIIPYNFESKKYGLVTIYDFAGHREFYSSHTVLLQSSFECSPPIILLVVDLRDACQDIKQNLQYWLSFLDNQCSQTSRKPHVIIVGSHADVLKSSGENITEKELMIQSFTHIDDLSSEKNMSEKEHIAQKSTFLDSVNIVGFVSMNCQYSESSSMTKLRRYLTESCKSLRITGNIKLNAHCFLVYLFDKFKEERAVTVNQIMQQITSEKQDATASSPLFFLPTNLSFLLNLCNELHVRGHILLLKDDKNLTSSWIIIDKEAVLSDVIGTIFAPEGLKQYSEFASNTGVIPLSRLLLKFSSYNPSMLMGFLTHLEFCHEISDLDILKLIGTQSLDYDNSDNAAETLLLYENNQDISIETDMPRTNETYLFFPALVKLEAPEHVKNEKQASLFAHHCGWILKCSKEEHFFTSRLLEVLLLRLVFSYALISPPDKDSPECNTPMLRRKCSIWKNGIFWGNHDGVETTVEVLPNNKEIVVCMRCLDKASTLSYFQLRSSIIKKVLTTVSDFCAKVPTTEYLIDPTETLSYPLVANKLYSIKEIAALIAQTSSTSMFVVSESGESVPLQSVLNVEPYTILDKRFMVKLFSDDVSGQYVTDSVLSSLTRSLLNCNKDICIMFTKMFNSDQHNAPTFAQLFHILKQWRSSCSGTYSCLRQTIDEYSIFGGRNILKLADMSVSDLGSQNELEWDTTTIPLKDNPPKIYQLEQLSFSDSKTISVIESTAAKWEEIAIFLGLDTSVIERIGRDYSSDCKEACSQMFAQWLMTTHLEKPVTWNTLIHCLKDADFDSIAEDLQDFLDEK